MSESSSQFEILEDPSALARRAAEWMTTTALAATDTCRVSLSGGSTPKALYELLAAEPFKGRFPWRKASWYWGDERFVPPDHPESNYRMASEAMLAKVPVPPENVHPIPTDGSPEDAAKSYQRTLQRAYGASSLDPGRPLFDIMLLGIGADGHTASLLPGDPALDERRRWVVPVARGRPEVRITLTLPAIESSRYVAFLAEGKSKASILAAVRTGGSDLPAARVRPAGQLLWFVDRAAAGG